MHKSTCESNHVGTYLGILKMSGLVRNGLKIPPEYIRCSGDHNCTLYILSSEVTVYHAGPCKYRFIDLSLFYLWDLFLNVGVLKNTTWLWLCGTWVVNSHYLFYGQSKRGTGRIVETGLMAIKNLYEKVAIISHYLKV